MKAIESVVSVRLGGRPDASYAAEVQAIFKPVKGGAPSST